jgi:high affinity Mn2+ porin
MKPARTDSTRPRNATPARALGGALAALVLFAGPPVRAQAAPPAPHEDQAFDFMNVLTDHGLHDLVDEAWNAYGQSTAISMWKPAFRAPYTNANGSVNSLSPDAEQSWSWTVTLFFGLHLWPGGEAYVSPEVIAEQTLSNLKGIGAAHENFEFQKTGGTTPALYRSRTFLRQTFGFGGDRVEKTSDPLQLGTVVDGRRLVLTLGNFSALDVFDKNGVLGDPRQGFINQSFMTYAAYDFPADARGYSWGATAELFWDDWAIRVGSLVPPQTPNGEALDLSWRYWGDSMEIEHDHVILGQAGAARFLAYANYEDTGRFNEAIAAYKADPAKNAASCGALSTYGSGNFTAPDLCWVRRPHAKVGVGINLEQYVAPAVGLFFRGMITDGQSEVDAYDSSDDSLTVGAMAKGALWHRPFDVAGMGLGLSWISDIHAQYLAMGGVDGFIGDGHLRQAVEGAYDVFYSFNLFKALWLSVDYQHIWNPAYNADRGPVEIVGGRAHVEF